MKKKIAVGVALIAFLLAGSRLWYTRPQTFWDATGMDRDKITGASCYAIEGHVTAGRARQQIWMLDNLIPGQENYEALLALLEDTTYCASLQNLLPPSSSCSADDVTATASFALGMNWCWYTPTPGKVWISPAHSRTLAFFRLCPGAERDPGRLYPATWSSGRSLVFSKIIHYFLTY